MSLESSDCANAPSGALVELIHEHRGHLSTAQRVQGAHSLASRIDWKRQGSRARWVVSSAIFAGVVACAVAAVVVTRHGGRSLSYAVDEGRADTKGLIEAVADTHPRLRFSDGTEVVLDSGAKASVRAVGGHGARLSLIEGVARVDVVHLPGARWLFDAGPFLINVTGTAFTLAWNPSEELLDVRMARGTVEVNGPLSDGAIVLRSGQHLTVRVQERETVIRDQDEGAVHEPAPVVAESPPAEAEPEVEPAAAVTIRGGRPARSNVRALSREWPAQVAAGSFEDVVRQAQRLGLDACLTEATSGQLAALADAARYRRHDDVARRALLAQRRRFPRSPLAGDSSFLLGRLEETEQNVTAALDWYDRYLAESPVGTYASEALGRKMNLVQRLSGDERAGAVATEYLGRFPQGTYAARARVLARVP